MAAFNLASKMAAKLSFQVFLEFTGTIRTFRAWWTDMIRCLYKAFEGIQVELRVRMIRFEQLLQ